ncbi:MAG: photosystem II complex extrinsic protein PsbU [Waterburya sp.]
MKRLGIWLSIFCLILISCWGLPNWTQSSLAEVGGIQSIKVLAAKMESPLPLCAESNVKIDLNNANVNAFTDCPGFYPNLARLIVENSPYQQVKDVLNIPDLSDHQKDLLEVNLDSFEVAESIVPLEQRMPPRPSMR